MKLSELLKESQSVGSIVAKLLGGLETAGEVTGNEDFDNMYVKIRDYGRPASVNFGTEDEDEIESKLAGMKKQTIKDLEAYKNTLEDEYDQDEVQEVIDIVDEFSLY